MSKSLREAHGKLTLRDDLLAEGRAKRSEVPRSSHSSLNLAPGRNPLGILEQQNITRLQELIPLRYERMLQNPFAFYRGSAAVQAADLSKEPRTGWNVLLSGDAHLSNFGFYSSPQRSLVFDLNDFDESAYGPWEWDVKRLAASVAIAASHNGFSPEDSRKAVTETVRAYRENIARLSDFEAATRYFIRADISQATLLGQNAQPFIERSIKKSKKRTSERAYEKMTETASDGSVRIVEQPPVLQHLEAETEEAIQRVFRAYLDTASPDIALLLSQFTPTDVVLRVVGVGSVGTRCYVMVLTGPANEPLLLQFKEASSSVIHQFGEVPLSESPGFHEETATLHPGYRVVASQKSLQAVSDPFLGYVTVEGRGFYVRQFRDGNISVEVELLQFNEFIEYVKLCGMLLARGHAQSPNVSKIAGYLGKSDVFDRAIADWAEAYAAISLSDFKQLKEQVSSTDGSAPE